MWFSQSQWPPGLQGFQPTPLFVTIACWEGGHTPKSYVFHCCAGLDLRKMLGKRSKHILSNGGFMVIYHGTSVKKSPKNSHSRGLYPTANPPLLPKTKEKLTSEDSPSDILHHLCCSIGLILAMRKKKGWNMTVTSTHLGTGSFKGLYDTNPNNTLFWEKMPQHYHTSASTLIPLKLTAKKPEKWGLKMIFPFKHGIFSGARC